MANLTPPEADFVRRMCGAIDQIPELKSLIINQASSTGSFFTNIQGKLPYGRVSGTPTIPTLPSTGTWTDVPFAANWDHAAVSYKFQYRVQPNSRVELRGGGKRITSTYSGYPQLIGILPVAPSQQYQAVVGTFDAGSSTYKSRLVVIGTDGSVKLFATADGNTDGGDVGNTVLFDGVSFGS